MDFCKLSQETIDLSEKIGPRQQQLLFDTDYYSDDVTFAAPDKNEEEVHCHNSAGIIYFIDKGAGSFCVRGVARESFDEQMDRQLLIEENRHFSKADDLLFFPCPNLDSAQIICDQIVNRRYPFLEESLCNISDPGPGWWLDYSDDSIAIYFKQMGNKGQHLQNIGPIGDLEVAKIRWGQISKLFTTVFNNMKFSQSDKGLFLKFDKFNGIAGESYLDDLLSIFLDGENNFSFSDFQMSMEAQTLQLYFSELALTRKFWITINNLIARV